ncbi:MAG: hypothetical protein FWD67_10775 [Betaproteobacteria bacterium]|nr:hypothetical protein [Betaproteobacteria bacterium]
MINRIEFILDLSNSQVEIEWGRDYESKFSNLLVTNNRLFNVIKRVGYKAVMGVAVTLTELVQQRSKTRFPGINVNQEFASKIESLWAGAVDPLYLKTFKFGYKYFDENRVLTPYSSNWRIITYITKEYIGNSFYIYGYLVNLSTLARHLMPNKKLFDDWFAEIMRKTAEVFPSTYDYADLNPDDRSAKYDCSIDAPVPREFFFDPEFKYSEEAAKPVLNAFLKSLDYNNNPWLCTPEEMLAKGFKGTPYEV